MYISLNGETEIYNIALLLAGDYGRVISEFTGYLNAEPNNNEIKFYEKIYERDLQIGDRVFTVRSRERRYFVPRFLLKPLEWSTVEQIGIDEFTGHPNIIKANR